MKTYISYLIVTLICIESIVGCALTMRYNQSCSRPFTLDDKIPILKIQDSINEWMRTS